MFNHSARIIICGCSIALTGANATGAQQRAVVARQAVVPSVTGISLDSARRVLAAFRLTDSSDRSAPGTAIVRTQDPAAGSPIPQNRTIRLAVSRRDLTAIVSGVAGRVSGITISGTADGPVIPKVIVPRVLGTPSDVAARRLSEVRLRMSLREVQTRTVGPGIVISQNPRAGDSAAVGSTVTVTANQATEIATPPQRTVPDVTNRTVDDARQVLAGARLFTAHDSTPSRNGPYGIVVRQFPTAGQPVPDNGQVQVLTLYQPPKVMPTVVGLTRAAARQRLADEGITLGSLDTRVSADSVELVVSQVPSAGETVMTGTMATLTIGAQPLVIAGGNPPVEGSVTQPTVVVPDSVDVPPVIGRSLAEARRILIARRLRVNFATSAAGTDIVATETPVNVRVPVNTIVRLTITAPAATASATTTPPPTPPQNTGDVNTNPPIIPEENGGFTKSPGFWLLVLGLAATAIAIAGALWKLFRNPARRPTPSRPSNPSAREPSPAITEPRMAFKFGRGAASDSVDSLNAPLITRSIELIPQIGTATSEIIGPSPTVEVINWEGR